MDQVVKYVFVATIMTRAGIIGRWSRGWSIHWSNDVRAGIGASGGAGLTGCRTSDWGRTSHYWGTGDRRRKSRFGRLVSSSSLRCGGISWALINFYDCTLSADHKDELLREERNEFKVKHIPWKEKRKTYQGEDDDSIHGNMRWIATASCAEEKTSEQLEVSD